MCEILIKFVNVMIRTPYMIILRGIFYLKFYICDKYRLQILNMHVLIRLLKSNKII